MLTSPFLYAFREREMIINMLNELSGARLTFNYMRVGGVKWDAPEGWIEKVKTLFHICANNWKATMIL